MAYRLALTIAVILVFAPVVRAQEPSPVSLKVEAGYDGHYRSNQWFPITVEASNSGSDISGVLEWRFPGQRDEGGVFQREISLPRGANKRLTLSAFSRSFARSGELRLLVDGAELLQMQVRLEPADPSQFMIGVLSSDPALLNSLSAMTMANSSTVQVNHINPGLLPDDASLLMGLDVIFIHDTAADQLTDAQRAALTLWVQLGGQLVVSGGGVADGSAAGMAALLPVDVRGLRQGVALDGLQQLGGATADDPPRNATATDYGLRENAAILDRDGLIVAWRQGMGRVIFTAFDLALLRGWPGEPALWGQAFDQTVRFLPAVSQRDSLLQNQSVLQLPVLGLPGFGTLLIFVLIYIMIIGPLNYLFVLRLRRPELAWATIPATIMVFVLGTYIYGVTSRGARPVVSQLALVQGTEGQGRGQATAFVGLFSPRRASYDLRFPVDALVSEASSFDSPAGNSPVRWTDAGTEIPGTLVDVSSLRTFVTEQAVDVPPDVESQSQITGQQARGNLLYRGGAPLEDAVVVWGDAAQDVGTLRAGTNIQFELRSDMSNFPGGFGTTDGLFNRRGVLAAFFSGQNFGNNGPGGFVTGIPDRSAVYLLGWRPAPSVQMDLNGALADQQGLTLYMIRLDTTK